TLVTAATTLIYAGRLDVAANWCEVLGAEAGKRLGVKRQAPFSAARAEIAMRAGDLPAAAEHARAALAALPGRSWGAGIGGPLASLLAATTGMGRFAEAEIVANQPVPDAMLRSRFGLPYRHARGLYHLATDRLYAALGDFQSCGELMA